MVSRLIKKSPKKPGTAPGTLVHVGEKKIEKARISIIDYDEQNLEEKEVKAIEECFPFKDKPTITWVNIDGLHDVEMIGKIGKHFDVHPLVLESIVNTGQRPKMEDFDNHIFIVLKMLYYDDKIDDIVEEQFSLILGSNFVITFQERIGDVFNPVRERIRKTPRVRMLHSDYLAYALVDAVVDGYFAILEKLGDRIEELEEELLAHPTPEALQTIYHLKRKLISLRRSVWPLREVIARLERGDSDLIHVTTAMYFRDVYDHTIQVIDTVESFRDMVSGMMDTYLSSLSNRMNEVMKVLTLIATIFIPLTFIAGIYGMNFGHMPELQWSWSYPLGFWLIIVVIAGFLIVMFKRRRWL